MMDKTLLKLLVEAWENGERAAVLALVNRLKETSSDVVVETFLEFRRANNFFADVNKLLESIRNDPSLEQLLRDAAALLPPATETKPAPKGKDHKAKGERSGSKGCTSTPTRVIR